MMKSGKLEILTPHQKETRTSSVKNITINEPESTAAVELNPETQVTTLAQQKSFKRPVVRNNHTYLLDECAHPETEKDSAGKRWIASPEAVNGSLPIINPGAPPPKESTSTPRSNKWPPPLPAAACDHTPAAFHQSSREQCGDHSRHHK
jgi:hypothetical protein